MGINMTFKQPDSIRLFRPALQHHVDCLHRFSSSLLFYFIPKVIYVGEVCRTCRLLGCNEVTVMFLE